MPIKKPSKYVNQLTIDKSYKKLKGIDLIIFSILHKTGIRVSEIKEYLESCFNLQLHQRSISLTPAKKNWDRVLPIVISASQIELAKKYSSNTDTLRKRIASWQLGFSAHDLRATFATNAHVKGINPITIQRILGHKELKSTLKYLRISTENDLWIYDLVIEKPDEWSTSSDVMMLKQRLGVLSKQNAKLKWKLNQRRNNE